MADTSVGASTRIIAALRTFFHGYVGLTRSCRQMEQPAWVLRTMGSPTASSLPRCFNVLDPWLPQQAADFRRRCTSYHGTTYEAPGDRVGTREGSGLRVLNNTARIWWVVYRSTNSVSTASTISMPVTAWAVKCGRILGLVFDDRERPEFLGFLPTPQSYERPQVSRPPKQHEAHQRQPPRRVYQGPLTSTNSCR